jgi:hypothetical protein
MSAQALDRRRVAVSSVAWYKWNYGRPWLKLAEAENPRKMFQHPLEMIQGCRTLWRTPSSLLRSSIPKARSE